MGRISGQMLEVEVEIAAGFIRLHLYGMGAETFEIPVFNTSLDADVLRKLQEFFYPRFGLLSAHLHALVREYKLVMRGQRRAHVQVYEASIVSAVFTLQRTQKRSRELSAVALTIRRLHLSNWIM